ncbi:PREDICTED: uncharacterized protein LOC108359449 isoform X2 [Rhagoletis zephyria]|uniref:uncharacterized protein LOC108359449 isoform X1 n=1 Tax=Rhagoletis zephyria TaxID=28612 RepID=UPI000811634F|nr:PREDICTED: uncharacterized protein LOC108359449 isoform X1 [Rhagoletis zephyria]XP_017466817.1 PREDICTED: uncharacterized protein LOC108359449 isoform X2 [Rhagoletis zephyria]
MPTALALAQELESNQARSIFASKFADSKNSDNRVNRPTNIRSYPTPNSPHFSRLTSDQAQQKVTPMEIDPSLSKLRHPTQQALPFSRNRPTYPSGRTPFGNPLPTSATATNAKRPHGSDQFNYNKLQRINILNQCANDDVEGAYTDSDAYDEKVSDEGVYNRDDVVPEVPSDEINFLE